MYLSRYHCWRILCKTVPLVPAVFGFFEFLTYLDPRASGSLCTNPDVSPSKSPGPPWCSLAPALVSEIRQLGPTANSLGDVGIQHWLSPYCLLFFEDFLDLTEVLFGLSFPTPLGSETARKQEVPGSEYMQAVLSRIFVPSPWWGWDWGSLAAQDPGWDPWSLLRKVEVGREQCWKRWARGADRTEIGPGSTSDLLGDFGSITYPLWVSLALWIKWGWSQPLEVKLNICKKILHARPVTDTQ